MYLRLDIGAIIAVRHTRFDIRSGFKNMAAGVGGGGYDGTVDGAADSQLEGPEFDSRRGRCGQ